MLYRLTFRKSAFCAAIGLLASTVTVPSFAQTLLNNIVAWPGLTPDDIQRMEAAAARLYEGRSIGTVERWRNPDTKNAGEVTLTRSFDIDKMPCRTVDYKFRFDSVRHLPTHYIMNWCNVPDGGWKIVEVAPPR
jgi:surface antigen